MNRKQNRNKNEINMKKEKNNKQTICEERDEWNMCLSGLTKS